MIGWDTETIERQNLETAASQMMQQIADTLSACTGSVDRMLETIAPKALSNEFIAAIGLAEICPQIIESVLGATGLVRLADESIESLRWFREIEAPGTLLGDYLIIVLQRGPKTEPEAALERLATRLFAYPVEPIAKGALRRLAALRGVSPELIIKGILPAACLLALGRADEPQVIREGEHWIKTGDGRKATVVPTEHYDIPHMARFQKYLRQQVRNLVEEELLALDAMEQRAERASLESELGEYEGDGLPANKLTYYERIEDHLDRLSDAEMARDGDAAREQDRLLDLLDRVLTPADRDLLERSERGGLDARDRKRLERRREKLRVMMSQKRP